MKVYNPGVGSLIIASRRTIGELATNHNIPTLGLLNGTYGTLMPLEWLKIQFGSVNDYAENAIGMTKAQLEELSSLVLAEYYYLNMAEICLFVSKLKLGKYGEFYGAVGAMKIASALAKFRVERAIDIERHEREEESLRKQKERDSWSATSITYEEYKKMGGYGKEIRKSNS